MRTSWAPPEIYVCDEINKIVKIKFNDTRIPIGTSLQLCVQGVVSQKSEVVNKTVLLDAGKITQSAVDTAFNSWLYIKRTFQLFIAASLVLFFIQGTTFGNFIIDIWAKFNAAKVIQMADEIDPRIATNIHPVYKTASFTQLNASVKDILGESWDLTKTYNFVGNNILVTKNLITDSQGKILKLEWGDASSYCKIIGGRLLELSELQAYLAGKYLTIENFAWPISLKSNIPEWSGTNVSWDNYWLYIKQDGGLYVTHYDNIKILKNGYQAAEVDDGEEHAFRCGLEIKNYTNK
jgi:hypothetical protein